MRKILLLSVFAMGIFNFANAQVIDLIGKGIIGKTTANLTPIDVNNIDFVDVYAIYSKRSLNPLNSTAVSFSSVLETPITNFFDYTNIINQSIVPDPINGAYYTARFNNVDNNGVSINILEAYKTDIHSFYAYVHKNPPNATYKSFLSQEKTVYFYHNGSNDPYVFNIPIETASSARNVTVKIPISELDALSRNLIIDITAGSVSEHFEANTYNKEESLFIGEYILENVPGSVNNIAVSIYSPVWVQNEQNGDSFYISTVVADVDIVDRDPGCTLTQGYWKTHSTCKVNRNGKGPKRDDTWDKLPKAESTIFFLSGQDYCEVFATEPGDGGKYYILAHQYIAAQLNMLNGASASAVISTFNESTDFLNTYTPNDVNYDQDLQSKAVELGGILDDYNNGIIGPGHCDNNESDKVAQDTNNYSRINIFPNPVTDYGTISLDSNHKGRTTIELYSNRGQRVDVLYDSDRSSKKSKEVQFSTSKYKKGRYFVIVKDGNTIHKKQIVIK